jgi:hypothetical protein
MQGLGLAAVDLVLAQYLEELQVAELAARAWASRASRVSSMPPSLSLRSVASSWWVLVIRPPPAGRRDRGRRGDRGHRGWQVADQRGRSVQQRRDLVRRGVLGLKRQRHLVRPGGQDALDRAIRRVAKRQCPAAGGVQAPGPVTLDQAQHALDGAQVVQRVTGQQLADQPADMLAGLGGPLSAPGRGAL